MLHVALYQPEIPPNTGNIIRLCANTGFHLHLIRPLGFSMDDRQLRRAGLDYHEFADIRVHDNLQALFAALPGGRCFAFTTRASVDHTAATFAHGDILLFGPETRGLPTEVLEVLMLRSAGCAAALLPAVEETITKAVLTGEVPLLRATLGMMLCCEPLRRTDLKGHRSLCRTLQALQSKAEGGVGEGATWRRLDEAAPIRVEVHVADHPAEVEAVEPAQRVLHLGRQLDLGELRAAAEHLRLDDGLARRPDTTPGFSHAWTGPGTEA